MFLITSAAYVAPELSAEFGLLPPAFLPVGNRRLFVHQLQEITAVLREGAGEPVHLSLPEDFALDPMDRDLLDRLGVVVLRVPAGLTLGWSILHCLEAGGWSGGPVRLLHGDTLIRDLPLDSLDVVTVGSPRAYYRWSEVETGADGAFAFDYGLGSDRQERKVLSGYFAFSDGARLTAAIAASGGDFIRGLTLYAHGAGLTPVEAGPWLDFGSLPTYYQSKAELNRARAFNRLSVTRRTVRKASRDGAKMAAEAGWYRALPGPMRLHTPAFVGEEVVDGIPGYAIEHLFLPTLSDLFVFGRLPPFVWRGILAGLDEFLRGCMAHPVPAAERAGVATQAMELCVAKTRARLHRYAEAARLDLERPWRLNGRPLPSLAAILNDLAARLEPPAPDDLCLVHGDLCFSNVFYDFRLETVRVIDPRGMAADGTPTPWGDIRYDLAKVRHSMVGRYDMIMAGYYHLEEHAPYDLTFELPETEAIRALAVLFRQTRLAGRAVEAPSVKTITVLLFLSMLPLHADEPCRQKALLANALRLYTEL